MVWCQNEPNRPMNTPSVGYRSPLPYVVGEVNSVKNAIAIISSRLRESQHRDRTHFHNRLHSPDRFFPHDDFIPHMNNTPRRMSVDGSSFGSRLPAGLASGRSNNFVSHPSGYTIESGDTPVDDDVQPFSVEDLVFRILCPIDKVDSVVGESDGIIELLQNEIGVDVKVSDPVAGSDEQIIIISSDEFIFVLRALTMNCFQLKKLCCTSKLALLILFWKKKI
ncbi:hypothetical protein CsSME_00029404 [Camellia sinensis var. sinensis]